MQKFQNIDNLHAKYNAVGYVNQLELGGLTYTLVDVEVNGIERIRKYICEEDNDLFLYIHLISDVLFKVYPRYEINQFI